MEEVSLFIEPKISDIKYSKELGADCVELHTGKYCNLFNKRKNTYNELLNLKNSSLYAKKISLEVHAGHGLTYTSIKRIAKISAIKEFNIGHLLLLNRFL